MNRFFPHPILSLVLVLVWLLLVNTVTLNAIVFGAILGFMLPLVIRAYWPGIPRLRKPVAVAAYVLIVLLDIVKANVQVALIVLFKPSAQLRPAWIRVPLEVTRPEAITLLAGTITMTPGTVSCDMTADGHALLVHCLHAPDPDAVRDDIKHRYERRLKEIFP
ncbi:MAG: Na+/H+ antiporter subunit E [Proteobacteria bacterium]|nr:Na+/H+ antiporter subunit E [Pseudomonadota bacterium]